MLDPVDKAVSVICPPTEMNSGIDTEEHVKVAPQTREPGCPNESLALREVTRVNLTPYLVALILDESQFCSGALLSREFVVTTAHCTSG